MAVISNFDTSKTTLTIKITGKFDFGAHQDFRNAIDQINVATKFVVLDFSTTDYMDSSALGMLLVLRDKVNSTSQAIIKLINIKSEVRKILEIANFDKLFSLG